MHLLIFSYVVHGARSGLQLDIFMILLPLSRTVLQFPLACPILAYVDSWLLDPAQGPCNLGPA